MHTEDQLELLNKIEKVEVPYFLYTRIQQKILHHKAQQIRPVFAWALGISFLLIFILNLLIIKDSFTSKASSIQQIVTNMHLLQNNSIYHE